jgi:hypothetical protein
MYTNTNTITPLLELIKAGYKTNTGERHLKGRRLAMFYLLRWALVLGAWALLSLITYIIVHG